MKQLLQVIVCLLCVFTTEYKPVYAVEAQQAYSATPYWKTVINNYPNTYKVIAVFEVVKDEWINILYSNEGKYYCQSVFPKKKTSDTPDKFVKKGKDTYQQVNEPSGYLKVTPKTVDGIYDGVLMESWKRLK